jgi:hypothetical protein
VFFDAVLGKVNQERGGWGMIGSRGKGLKLKDQRALSNVQLSVGGD